MFSYFDNLVCTRCKVEYSPNSLMKICKCGSGLFAEYDYISMSRDISKEVWSERPNNIWKYHELLPIYNPENIISFNETHTPIIPFQRYGEKINISNISIKNEGTLPSGSFKARGAAIGVSKVKELNYQSIGISTNGNAGAAWSLYAARAGIPITVVMPSKNPDIPKMECVVAGADLRLIDGTISEAGKVLRSFPNIQNIYNVSTLCEPYRLEGKKTIGFEICEQYEWLLPDVIVYPTGGGAGIIGIYKAFWELQRLGWLTCQLPRIVVVQASGCAPIERAYSNGEQSAVMWSDPETIAFGMSVPNPIGDFLILDLIRSTNGVAISVTDEEIISARDAVGRLEGIHLCPEGAAAIAGIKQLRECDWISKNDRVLSINTATGLKYMM